MAYIAKRGKNYTITVSCGYDTSGKQIKQFMTYKPTATTPKQIEKEVQKQAVIFEEACKQGQVVTAAIKFENFANDWLENVAALNLKAMTLSNYRNVYSKVVNKAIGHMKLDKIKHEHIQKFINDLSVGGKYREHKLSSKSIKNYVCFISGVFEYAKKKQVITFNPCSTVTLPREEIKEKEIYSVAEMQNILELLNHEDKKDFQFAVYFKLAVYTGFRRGEMLGLEFKDIDFDRQIISVKRTSNYTKEKGVYTDSPKTKTSYRTLKLPLEIMELLRHYKEHQAEYAESIGDLWEDHDRLFTTWDGKPMFITTPRHYFEQFCKRNGIRYLNLHSMRHFNASAMIQAGVDVKAVQNSLGHSVASTTLNLYCHAFQAAQAAAMDSIVGVIGLPQASNS